MRVAIIIFNYFIWHYGQALKSLLVLYRNFFQFSFNFFSLSLMFRTWISPWRRLDLDYQGNIFNAGQWFEAFVVNILMRLVGFLIRTIIIIVGLGVLVLLSLSLPLVLLSWLVLPFGVVVAFLVGLGLLFLP
ncbi:MAG: hypothetical protein COX02_00340 [Candidatus Vogelbacteria bacterium CG22_combo_CG10-13_8_21_14_all_37_9]|uniref:Uncharacterized protein n=1 Tax=Candidatus Vogelbacteria bacterium CG22_combo_CG10-13_8_21_14_all_37_9 TaxID=1975046 RepID=A0A2H0BL60_9BACT|nr:MAG: hypothetical protein BK005_01810 [bacterium CG10_37_50]PIP58413.1 MAG: hypothetical protein COX02_00340 [Candidatus Vogelbacteria bacterium CG22_combo_CG10-13_8_21_14_all_37_9]